MDLFWWLLWIFWFVAYIYVVIVVITDLFRAPDGRSSNDGTSPRTCPAALGLRG